MTGAEEQQAFAARIRKLATRIKDPRDLMDFAGKFEAEYIVCETIHACARNRASRGDAFSFKGNGLKSITGGGLTDNAAGLALCFRRKWLREETRPDIADPPDNTERNEQGHPLVLVPTNKLLLSLEAYLADD